MKPTPFPSRTTPWRVVIPTRLSENGRREQKYFASKNAALEFILTFKEQKRLFGQLSVTPEEVHYINVLKREVGDVRLLPEIIAHWKRTNSGILNKVTVREAAVSYINRYAKMDRSKRTLSELRYRLNTFCLMCGDRMMHEITSAHVQQFLDNQSLGWQRRDFYKHLRPFFYFGRQQRMLSENPMEFIKPPEIPYKVPELYKVNELAEILRLCRTSFSDLLPFVVCSAYGFVRTAELVRTYAHELVLHWEDVLWDENLIHVKHGVAKATKRKSGDERFIPINESLRHWLEPAQRTSGPVVDLNHIGLYSQLGSLLRQAGIKLVPNGFRHSALSYWLAANPQAGVGALARMAGNSEATAKRHYIKLLKEADGKAWFGLRRESNK
jgi:integrase